MTKLINGKIPAFTECPFRNKCEIAQHGQNRCSHLGLWHSVAFSCASARAFDLIEEIKNERKDLQKCLSAIQSNP